MSRFLLLNFQDFGLDHHITKTIQSHTLFCICCLVKNVPFLNLSNCIHGKYLEDFPKPDLRSFKEVICYQCHATLKRIEVFRQQVADSFNILKDEAYKINEIENIKKLNFEMHNAVNIYLPPVMKSLLDNPTSKEPVKNPPTVNIKKERESTEVKESEYTEVPIKIEASTVETLRENEMNEVEEIRNECIIKIEQEFDDIKLVPMESVNECDDQMTISDTELRAQTVKTKMKSIKSSKIKSIKLTKEELANERLEIAKSVSFLKNPHRCERCLIGFRYKENMMDHLQRKHEQKVGSVTCEICLQVLHPPETIKAHTFRHYSRYRCEECGKHFQEIQEAYQHYKKQHSRDANFKCRQCDYVATNRTQLLMHKLRHERHSCRDCGLVLTSNAGLRRHMIVTHKKALKKCRQCRVQFESEKAYVSHMRSHCAGGGSGGTGTAARCAPCNITFKNWHSYSAHLSFSYAHNNYGKYKCDDCGMRFGAAPYLRVHAQTRHARSLAYKCPQCPKLFSLAAEVKLHIQNVHSEKRFVTVCDHCGKAFMSRLHLLRHINESHSEKQVKKKNIKSNKKTKLL